MKIGFQRVAWEGFGAGKMDDGRGLMSYEKNRNLDCAKLPKELKDKLEMIRITCSIDLIGFPTLQVSGCVANQVRNLRSF
jgi:hypothetical protein